MHKSTKSSEYLRFNSHLKRHPSSLPQSSRFASTSSKSPQDRPTEASPPKKTRTKGTQPDLSQPPFVNIKPAPSKKARISSQIFESYPSSQPTPQSSPENDTESQIGKKTRHKKKPSNPLFPAQPATTIPPPPTVTIKATPKPTSKTAKAATKAKESFQADLNSASSSSSPRETAVKRGRKPAATPTSPTTRAKKAATQPEVPESTSALSSSKPRHSTRGFNTSLQDPFELPPIIQAIVDVIPPTKGLKTPKSTKKATSKEPGDETTPPFNTAPSDNSTPAKKQRGRPAGVKVGPYRKKDDIHQLDVLLHQVIFTVPEHARQSTNALRQHPQRYSKSTRHASFEIPFLRGSVDETDESDMWVPPVSVNLVEAKVNDDLAEESPRALRKPTSDASNALNPVFTSSPPLPPTRGTTSRVQTPETAQSESEPTKPHQHHDHPQSAFPIKFTDILDEKDEGEEGRYEEGEFERKLDPIDDFSLELSLTSSQTPAQIRSDEVALYGLMDDDLHSILAELETLNQPFPQSKLELDKIVADWVLKRQIQIPHIIPEVAIKKTQPPEAEKTAEQIELERALVEEQRHVLLQQRLPSYLEQQGAKLSAKQQVAEDNATSLVSLLESPLFQLKRKAQIPLKVAPQQLHKPKPISAQRKASLAKFEAKRLQLQRKLAIQRELHRKTRQQTAEVQKKLSSTENQLGAKLNELAELEQSIFSQNSILNELRTQRAELDKQLTYYRLQLEHHSSTRNTPLSSTPQFTQLQQQQQQEQSRSTLRNLMSSIFSASKPTRYQPHTRQCSTFPTPTLISLAIKSKSTPSQTPPSPPPRDLYSTFLPDDFTLQ